MIIQLQEFSGEAPRWHPRALGRAFAQRARLTKFDRRTLAPYKQTLDVFAPSKAGVMQTIYRFGQNETSDADYWFHWTSVVSVIRSPANGGNDERTYYFGDGAPKVTDESLALDGGGTDYPIGYYLLGIPRPPTVTASVSGTATSDVPDSRVYVITYTNVWGEEGPPSLPSVSVDVKPGEVATVSIGQPVPEGAYEFAYKKIYRTSTGSTTTDYQLIDTVPITDSTYVDLTDVADLGTVLTTVTWEPPPSDLVGAVLMPNGIILAWRDNELWMSEPFVPYAYPSDYTLTTDSEIVGVAVSGMTAIVVTKSMPYLVTGVTPTGMTMEQLDIPQAGASRRAVFSALGGVGYASPDGLVFVNGRSAEVVTKDLFRREDWQALNPESMHCYVHDGKLFLFYDATSIGGVAGGYIIDFFGETQSAVEIGRYFHAGFVDERHDALFLYGLLGGLADSTAGEEGSGGTTQVAQLVVGYAANIAGSGGTTQIAQSADGTGGIYEANTTQQAAQSANGTGVQIYYAAGGGTQQEATRAGESFTGTYQVQNSYGITYYDYPLDGDGTTAGSYPYVAADSPAYATANVTYAHTGASTRKVFVLPALADDNGSGFDGNPAVHFAVELSVTQSDAANKFAQFGVALGDCATYYAKPELILAAEKTGAGDAAVKVAGFMAGSCTTAVTVGGSPLTFDPAVGIRLGVRLSYTGGGSTDFAVYYEGAEVYSGTLFGSTTDGFIAFAVSDYNGSASAPAGDVAHVTLVSDEIALMGDGFPTGARTLRNKRIGGTS